MAGSGYRHYVHTTVLDKWITVKPAYRLTLECGTELILSGDHRLLSNRGWKHVLGSPRGRAGPAVSDYSQSSGGDRAVRAAAVHDADYRRGYLCGIIRGDGLLALVLTCRSGRWRAVHRLLASGSRSPTWRRSAGLAGFSASVDVVTSERVFQLAAGAHREMTAISAQAATLFERISDAGRVARCFRACSGVVASWRGSSTRRGPGATLR